MTETFNEKLLYEYITAPVAYMYTCELLLKDIENKIVSGNSDYNEGVESLYLPLFYNFYHSIELYSKYYVLLLTGEHSYGHNICSLLNELMKVINDHGTKMKVEKLMNEIEINKKNTDYKYILRDYSSIITKYEDGFSIYGINLHFKGKTNLQIFDVLYEYIVSTSTLFKDEIYNTEVSEAVIKRSNKGLTIKS